MAKSKTSVAIIEEKIVDKIHLIRGQKVMIDQDLAELYGVETKRLNEQVKRNLSRFPGHYMFELSKEENEILRSQNATLRHGGHSKYLPYAFTENGVLMLANVLKKWSCYRDEHKNYYRFCTAQGNAINTKGHFIEAGSDGKTSSTKQR